MLSFKDFILIEDKPPRFAVGKDGDYFYDKYALITFTRNDRREYKVEGKTAGLQSHALKHLKEIDPEFVSNIVMQIKNTLVDYVEKGNHPKNYEFRYFKNERTEVKGDPIKLINLAPYEAVINFLDMVNDKVLLKKDLAPIEEKMKKYLKTLGDKYMEYLANMTKAAVFLDDIHYEEACKQAIRDNGTVCFDVKREGRDIRVFLNFANRFMILRTYGTINTGFQITGTTPDRASVINTFLSRFGRGMQFYKANTLRSLQSFSTPRRR